MTWGEWSRIFGGSILITGVVTGCFALADAIGGPIGVFFHALPFLLLFFVGGWVLTR